MDEEDKLFCPEFAYEICVALCVYDFLCKELALPMVAKHYSTALTERYKPVIEEEMSFPAEEILRFVSEQKNPQYEAHDKANSFIYNRLKFDGIRGGRKLKGLFGNAFTGDKKKQYSAEETIKNFKAFVFALRNGTVEKAPVGWTIKTESKEDLMQLGEIIHKETSIDNLLG